MLIVTIFFPTLQLQADAIGPEPTEPCTSKEEGDVKEVSADYLWLCKDGHWLPYQ